MPPSNLWEQDEYESEISLFELQEVANKQRLQNRSNNWKRLHRGDNSKPHFVRDL